MVISNYSTGWQREFTCAAAQDTRSTRRKRQCFPKRKAGSCLVRAIRMAVFS
jgi:hypothetical protein